MDLIIYEQTTSTNDIAKRRHLRHGDTIWALHQSAGRGQRGNKWSGGVGQNIAFTVVLEPTTLRATDQFLISQIAALALHSTMLHYGISSRVKWTNDLYVGDLKMGGILIENSLNDGRVTRSIVGIGLNINQLEFDPSLPNPTSMRQQSGEKYDREEVLRGVVERLLQLFREVESSESCQQRVRADYHEALYRRDEEHTYKLATGELVSATIEGVAPQGELMLRHSDGTKNGYLFRDVEFVIEGRDK